MADKDLFSKYSIDNILAEAKEITGKDSDKVWSLAEIDALLGGSEKAPPAEPKKNEPPHAAPKPAPRKEKPPESAAPGAAAAHEILPEKPLLEGVTPALGAQASSEPRKTPAEEVPKGQISIEKTRVFNEVTPHAVYKEDMAHHIGSKHVRTKTSDLDLLKGKGMETNKYRERFLNKPQLDMEKTLDHERITSARPPKTFEKYGVIVKKPENEKTGEDGLMPIPTIVSAEDELRAIHENELKSRAGDLMSAAMHNATQEDALLRAQIKLEGFDSEDAPERIDEYEAELDLLEKRRERAKKFRLFPNLEEPAADAHDAEAAQEADTGPDLSHAFGQEKTRITPVPLSEETEEAPEDEEAEFIEKIVLKQDVCENNNLRIPREYYSCKDAQAVYDILLSEKKKATVKTVVFSVIAAVLTVATAVSSFTGSFSVFGDSVYAFLGVNLACLLIACIADANEIKKSFVQLSKKRVSRSAAISVSLLFAFIQCAAAFGFPELIGNGTHIYAPAAFMPLLLIAAGDCIKSKNDLQNFKHIAAHPKSLHSVSRISNENDAFEIGRGLLLGDPDIRYSAKIAFPARFVEMTKRYEPENNVFRLALPAVLIAAVIVGAVSAFVSKNIFVGITAATGSVLIGMPCSAVLSSADILKRANKALARESTMISGYSAVYDTVKANAVAIDASDMFLSSGCRLYGIKLFHSMHIDDAILYTASVTIQSGGTLSSVFDGIILSKREILPPVESLAYEERLGCSGWINNQRVLVGNRELLSKHNVKVPEKEEEDRYKTDVRQVLYLAVEGKIAAMFVVGYQANTDTAKYLRRLEKYGVSILVRTTDPNITEGLIEQYFDLPHNFVKIINPVAGALFKTLCEEEKPQEPCGILHGGTVSTLLHGFASAFAVLDKQRISTVLQFIGIGIGILIEALLSFASGLSQAGVPQLLIFQAFFTLLVVLIPRIKRI